MGKLHVLLPLTLLAGSSSPATPPESGPLVVKASLVAAPCVAAAATPFQKTSGRRVSVVTSTLGSRSSATGADVVVGADEELTRIIEGGASDPEVEKDVARIPWVFVGTGIGDTALDLRALERSSTRVRVLGGIVGRHARESLERLPPARVQSTTRAPALRPQGPGEIALLPLSLAGTQAVASSSVPPLAIRALASADTRQPETARAFVDFLAGAGNVAFRTCGRETAR